MRGRTLAPLFVWVLLCSAVHAGGTDTCTRMHATFVQVASPGFTSYDGGTLPPAWGDYDDDGYPDLPLYHNNRDGTFSEIPGFRDLLKGANFHGASWADYDGDGHLDLAILAYEKGSTVLLHNLGEGRFEDVAPKLGMNLQGSGESAVWGDYNGDGLPDLFAPYYAHVYPFRSMLYKNNGDGTFTEVSYPAGVTLKNQPEAFRPEGAQWIDIDDDGYLDLYCAQHLFINDHAGHFTDVRQQVGLPKLFDEGVAFIDYDNDGDFDLYLRTVDAQGGRLFRNDGGMFTEVTAQAGIPPGGALWGDSWADVNNDGYRDLLYFREDEPALLLINQGDGTFVEDPDFTALGIESSGSAWADYDRDGDMDVVIGYFDKILLKNQLDQDPNFPNSSIRVRVLDDEGHRTKQGSVIRMHRVDEDSGGIQTRVVDGGSGYLSQRQYAANFGVCANGVYSLEVRMPTVNGVRTIINRDANPVLGEIHPDQLTSKLITVYPSGKIVLNGVEVTAPKARVAPSHWALYK